MFNAVVKYEHNTVVLLRMNSGEMVMGRYTVPGENNLVPQLSRPRTLIIQPLPNGQASIQLVALGAPFFTEEDSPSIEFPGPLLATLHKKAPKELENAYIQATSKIRVSGVGNLMPSGTPRSQ